MKAALGRVARGVAALAVMLAGCAGGPGSRPAAAPAPAPYNLSGYSPTFKAGYADGCESATARAQRRNESRYKTEADYMMGWNDGYSACRRR